MPFAVTSLYAALLTLLVLVLGTRVAMRRFAARIGLGEGDDKVLRARVRVHGNAVENIPLALILMLLLELGGASAAWLHGCGIALLIGRLSHAWGVSRSSGATVQRGAGVLLTWGAMLCMAVWLIARFLGAA
jgi:uncharacterized membrane protein YecN with MAPEG domain